ncbi:MAG TPA: carbohydrate porin, partial [Candidatus Binatia bacterium]|nr:carbohydrate porin [Candidatus Binatia bacterium]
FDPGGRLDAFSSVDSGKLGLWKGGGLHTHVEYRFGDAVAYRGGALWRVNTGDILPLTTKDPTDNYDLQATSIYFTQRFGESTNLMIGKINAIDLLSRHPFFGGWGIHRFMNIAFVAPPSGVVPPVIMGAVLSHKLAPFSLTGMVFDPDDQTDEYWVDHLFADGVNVSLAGGWTGALAGRAANATLTGTYSTKDGADLSDLLLPDDIQGGDKEGSYNVSLEVGYLLVASPVVAGKGLGVYAKGAIADGNPNPIQGSFVGGFAGHGIVPSRPGDSFGIGYYFYDLSDDLQNTLDPLVEYDDEHGFEVFYNLAVLPWFDLGADFQIIDPTTSGNDAVVVAGLRTNVVF